jgi:hypothetical protein
MKHKLISLSDSPTMPVAWSSKARNREASGSVLATDDFYVVFESYPLVVMQMFELMSQKPVPELPIQYLYAASVFYRKSRNPHGPSSRPIYVFCLEYSELTCRMKPQGLWDSLCGNPMVPAELFTAYFFSDGRANLGQIPNDFTPESALEHLMEGACRVLQVPRHQFRHVGPLSLGPDSDLIS